MKWENMVVKREQYVDILASSMHNGLVKVVTGIRRCGKSFLLNELFRARLKEMGIKEENMLFLKMEDWRNRELRNPDNLLDKIEAYARNNGDMHYVVIDEVQMVDHFPEVMNSLLLFDNVDTYVTGSNSRFLSTDIATEFRGRSYEIHLAPLSFSEYLSVHSGTVQEAWDSYSLYGGLPGLLALDTEEKKAVYLRQLFNTVYLRDIMERNKVSNVPEIKELIRVMASCVGSPTNINNLTNTFTSKKNLSITNKTVASYVVT